MALTIRMQRHGSNKNPHYRLVVTEKTSPRDGKYVEVLGNYAPRDAMATRYLNLKMDRIEYWMKVGALPSDTARTLISKAKKVVGAATTKAA